MADVFRVPFIISPCLSVSKSASTFVKRLSVLESWNYARICSNCIDNMVIKCYDKKTPQIFVSRLIL